MKNLFNQMILLSSSPYKEPTVKYSEIAEPVMQPIPHLDHLPPSVLTKHKEKEYVEMCNIPQQSHLNKPYPDHQFNGQQSYPPDMSMHNQYMHKEPQGSQVSFVNFFTGVSQK